MGEVQTIETVLKIRIKETDVFFDNQGDGRGKLTLSNWRVSYSYYWGAMGSDLQSFITRINSDYFASKLLGTRNIYCFCPKKTMRNLRAFIKEEIPWYKHMGFQKDMREKINDYFSDCETSSDFVNSWNRFVDNLSYYEIDCRYDREEVESVFKDLSEPWYLIGETTSQEYNWLKDFHGELVNHLHSVKSWI